MSQRTAKKIYDSDTPREKRHVAYRYWQVNYRETEAGYQVLSRVLILRYGDGYMMNDMDTHVNDHIQDLEEVSFEISRHDEENLTSSEDVRSASLYAFGWRSPTDEEMVAIMAEERRNSRANEEELERLIEDNPGLVQAILAFQRSKGS